MVYIAKGVWHGRCHAYGRNRKAQCTMLRFQNLGIGSQELFMFEGKNNRILDSFTFRLALTVAILAAWGGASYLLLSV
jgi:hypothetical protein